jgi:hypothetical protein
VDEALGRQRVETSGDVSGPGQDLRQLGASVPEYLVQGSTLDQLVDQARAPVRVEPAAQELGQPGVTYGGQQLDLASQAGGSLVVQGLERELHRHRPLPGHLRSVHDTEGPPAQLCP